MGGPVGGDKGMCSLGAVCGTGMMSVPWIKPSLFSFPSPFLLAGTTNNKKIEELISSLKLLFSNGKFLLFGGKDCREAKSFVGQVSVCTNRGCLRCLQTGRLYHFNHTSSILKTPRPSTHHYYNSPVVNNHKSNGIHKPLRWCLLSLTLGS